MYEQTIRVRLYSNNGSKIQLSWLCIIYVYIQIIHTYELIIYIYIYIPGVSYHTASANSFLTDGW